MSGILDLLGPKRLVTQATSITTGVTLNARYGQITTFAASAAAAAEESFTLTNSFISPGSLVVCSFSSASAGTPFVFITPVAATPGTATVTITNIHAADALDALIVITFMVLS